MERFYFDGYLLQPCRFFNDPVSSYLLLGLRVFSLRHSFQSYCTIIAGSIIYFFE
ncbi:hypothetical protein YC2023_013119 [Brassica napus]